MSLVGTNANANWLGKCPLIGEDRKWSRTVKMTRLTLSSHSPQTQTTS